MNLLYNNDWININFNGFNSMCKENNIIDDISFDISKAKFKFLIILIFYLL